MLGGEDVIDTADGGVVRRRLHEVGIGLGLFSYLAHHSDEAVERLLRLVLRGLYHQTLVEEQREVDRRGVIAVVEQTLGHVHRSDTRRLILQAVEHELMTAEAVDGQLIDILE